MKRVFGTPALAGVLAALLAYLPGLQLLAPLPLFVTGMMNGTRAGWVAFGVMGLLSSAMTGSVLVGVSAVLASGLFAPMAVWLYHAGWGVRQGMSLAYLVAGVLMVLYCGWVVVVGEDPRAPVLAWGEQFKELVVGRMAAGGKGNAVTLQEMRLGLDEVVAIIAWVAPVLLLTGWFLLQLGNFVLARAVLAGWGMGRGGGESLASFRLPFGLVWLLIGASILTLFGEGGVFFFGLNTAIYLSVPYFFQGLAVWTACFERFRWPVFGRGAVYAAMVVWSDWAVPLTVLVGLFDVWMDFRNRFIFPGAGEGTFPE